MASNNRNVIDTSVCKPCSIELHRLKLCNLTISKSDFESKGNRIYSLTISLSSSDFTPNLTSRSMELKAKSKANHILPSQPKEQSNFGMF